MGGEANRARVDGRLEKEREEQDKERERAAMRAS